MTRTKMRLNVAIGANTSALGWLSTIVHLGAAMLACRKSAQCVARYSPWPSRHSKWPATRWLAWRVTTRAASDRAERREEHATGLVEDDQLRTGGEWPPRRRKTRGRPDRAAMRDPRAARDGPAARLMTTRPRPTPSRAMDRTALPAGHTRRLGRG